MTGQISHNKIAQYAWSLFRTSKKSMSCPVWLQTQSTVFMQDACKNGWLNRVIVPTAGRVLMISRRNDGARNRSK